MSYGAQRDYERAKSFLDAVDKFIKVERERDASLVSIEVKITDTDHCLSSRTEIADAIAVRVREELQRTISVVRIKAQDDLRVAAEALRAAIESDLNSNMMRD